MSQIGKAWFEALRPLCNDACNHARCPYATDVVLFYLARWCQKLASDLEPDVASFGEPELRDAAERIARHLSKHGSLVERVVQADSAALTELRSDVRESAGRRAGAATDYFTDEAVQKIFIVLATGTPPSKAVERLGEDLRGPSNEYVFDSPFPYWAKTVAIHLIEDERRRWDREQKPRAERPPRQARHLDRELLERACAALPGLVDAIRDLHPKQRSVMVLSLSRRDLDETVHERLHELAPDLFSATAEGLVSSDREIADRLGSTPRRVAANRSAARRKLAERDLLWELLLNRLLPHRTTRLIHERLEV